MKRNSKTARTHVLRAWWVRAGKLLVLFLIFYALLLLVGLIPVNRNFEEVEGGVPVYVISNGAHTDLAVPVANAHHDWRTSLNFAEFLEPTQGAEFVSFGWGDRAFYLNTPTWSDLKVRTALKASLVPTRSLVHVSMWYGEPSDASGFLDIRRVHIAPRQYDALVGHILESFGRSAAGRPELIDCCRYEYENDNFYEGAGRYHLFCSCNNWANTGLKRAGVRTRLWSPFSQPILWGLPAVPGR